MFLPGARPAVPSLWVKIWAHSQSAGRPAASLQSLRTSARPIYDLSAPGPIVSNHEHLIWILFGEDRTSSFPLLLTTEESVQFKSSELVTLES